MINLVLISLFFTSAICHHQEVKNEDPPTLRVMTFNIWNSAKNVENGQQKVAKHILLVNPDIVALQEVYVDVASNIVNLLGPAWTFVQNPDPEYPDTVILTKHKIVPNTLIFTKYGVGCEIMLDSGKMVHFWNAHLDYKNYGPSKAFDTGVGDVSQITANEYKERVPGMLEVLDLPLFQTWSSQSSKIPIVICGDFNVPSHLDWTKETKKYHNNWVVEWPTTKKLEKYGFIDSFRQVNPNVLENPGLTWSTVEDHKYTEPADRLDFIFYKGPIGAFKSVMYAGSETVYKRPYYYENDYPSDHYAVITDFNFV